MISTSQAALKAKYLMNEQGMSEQEAINKVLEQDGQDAENVEQEVKQQISDYINRDFDKEQADAEEQLKEQTMQRDSIGDSEPRLSEQEGQE